MASEAEPARERDFERFLLSFAVVARLPFAQHSIVRSVVAHDPVVTSLLMTGLLMMVFLRFPTAPVAEAGSQAATKVLYIGTMAISSLCIAAMAWRIATVAAIRDGHDLPDPPRDRRPDAEGWGGPLTARRAGSRSDTAGAGRDPQGMTFVSPPPGLTVSTLSLSAPAAGITDGAVRLRLPEHRDIDGLLPAFSDPELRAAGNLPAFTREEVEATLAHLPALAASGRLLPMVVADASSGEIVGGGTLHHLDAERSIIEIGYWVLPHARRRGCATRIARLLAEHSFALGIERVAAYVNVGNVASERVLERAGYQREGVVRSLPVPSGVRIDKTLFSLLRGDAPARRSEPARPRLAVES